MQKQSNPIIILIICILLVGVSVFTVNKVLQIKEVKRSGKIVFLFGELNEQEEYNSLLYETKTFCKEQNERENRDFDRESCDVYEVGGFKNDEYINSLSSVDYLFVYEQKNQFEVQLINVTGIKTGYLYKKEMNYNPNWISFVSFKEALGV
jgi:hypothetical protein